MSLFFCLFSLGTFSSEEPAKLRDIKEFTPEFNKVFVSLLILALVSILFTFFKWIIEKYWAKRKVKSSIKKLDLHDYLERMSNSSSKEDILLNLRPLSYWRWKKEKKNLFFTPNGRGVVKLSLSRVSGFISYIRII